MATATASSGAIGSWSLSDGVFQGFRDLIYREAGIALSDGKRALLVGRLARRVRALGLPSLDDYLALVSSSAGAHELVTMLDCICTNETQFFRDARQFHFLEHHVLQNALARARRGGPRRVHVWSAACSTGEEPYSIGMSLLAHLPATERWDVRITATDLSTRALEQAREGQWAMDRVEPVPPSYRKAFLLRGVGSQDGRFRASQALRQLIAFQRLNLNSPTYPVSGPFDAIFCRNVLIYFDADSKARVIERLLRLLTPEGVLFLGYAETVAGLAARVKTVGPNAFGWADTASEGPR